MQGSEIVHRVKPVLSCTEPRITVVNSYMSRNPFVIESNHYTTLLHEPTWDYEFTLHKAWRAREQLKALMMYNKEWPTNEDLIKLLNLVIIELEDCRDLLNGAATDVIGYYDPQDKEIVLHHKTDPQIEKKLNDMKKQACDEED